MRAIIILSTCIIISSAEGKPYTCFKRGILECVEETKVSTQLVLQVTSGNWNVRDDYRLKEWAKCLLIRSNMMSSQGVFQLDVALAGVADHDKSAVETLIDQCLFTSQHTPEEVAWHFLKCYHEIVQRRVALKGSYYTCFKRNILECIAETKIKMKVILQLTYGDWNVPDDDLIRKWAECLLVKSKMMSKVGVFQLDVALALVPKRARSSVESVIDQCLFSTPQKPEDVAWYFLKCYHTSDPIFKYL